VWYDVLLTSAFYVVTAEVESNVADVTLSHSIIVTGRTVT